MIVFVEPDSKWYDFVLMNRSHAPTIVVPLPFDSLVMSTTFTESFWEEQRSIDLEATVHRGTGVYKIWNEKLVMMMAATELNPFKTKFFTWIDAGYYRNERIAPKFNETIVHLDITKAGVNPSKVLFLHVRNDSLRKATKGRVATAGNAFIGTAEALRELYKMYYLTLWDWARKQYFIGSDQHIMAETCYRYSTVCHPWFPGNFKNWFAMSKLLKQREYNLSKASEHFYFEREPRLLLLPDPPRKPIKSFKEIQTKKSHLKLFNDWLSLL